MKTLMEIVTHLKRSNTFAPHSRMKIITSTESWIKRSLPLDSKSTLFTKAGFCMDKNLQLCI